jgi:hypothetical protein
MIRGYHSAFIVTTLLGCAMLQAETITVEQNTLDGFEAATRDRFIAVDSDAKAIRLARSYLITNETGVTGRFFDRLGENDLAKVRFDVPLPGFERALLLIYNSYTYKGNHPKFITVNGRQRPYVHDEARMLTGGWARHDIPADELKAGANEIIIGGAGGLHVDTFGDSGRSWRTFDGGRTWKPDALGPDGHWSGEYIVRLRVYGCPPAGQVTSPVIDPALVPKDPLIRPRIAVSNVTLRPRQNAPEGTQVCYEIRSGTTPTVLGRTWTDWQPAKADQSVPIPGHRYVQWRATLMTGSSSKTPLINGVRLELEAEVVRPDCRNLHVETCDNPTMIRSSYPFEWESDTPRVRHLREKHKLLDVIGGADDEPARQILLRKWVSGRWDKGWDAGKYNYIPPWDALELLELAPQHLSLGMCTHYSCTFVQCAAAVGYSARSVIIDHHCVAEVWSNALGKWVLQDTGPGPGPKGYPVGFMYQADGQWLNALEVHQALHAKRPVTAVPYKDLKEPYTLDAPWMALFVRFGIPLRNNHLSRPWPAEIEHGHEQYRWDGYLWYTESVDDPKFPEYSLLSNRVADFYYPLNRVAVDLQQHDADTLTVNLDTQTPNLARYEASIDDGAWQRVESGFQWKLHDSANRLRVRAVNTFGVNGSETNVAVKKG